MLSISGPKQCVLMQFDSQNTWNEHILFFSSLKIRNFENYCPSVVSLFGSGRKTRWTLLPKLSNNSTCEWRLEIVYRGRKLLSLYSSIVHSVSCLRLDLTLIKCIKWQFRIRSQKWLSMKQFWGMLVKILTKIHWVSPFLSLRDYF